MEKDEQLKIARKLVQILESEFKIGRFRFGLDPLMGLVPGVGDTLSAVISGYLIWVAMIQGVPTGKLLKMIYYIGVDYLFGLMPVIGDIFDFGFRSNTNILKILEEHLGRIDLK